LPLVSSASATLPTTSAISSSAIMPPGIQNLGNTCYLTTLVQITFWVAPLANGWIDAKLTKKESSKLFDQAIFLLANQRPLRDCLKVLSL
jgi:ubiquitin C-terminal hydrolase